MVIADTSVWIPFFNQPDSREKETLDTLIDADELALVGVVLAELLQGCRSRTERTQVADAMLALPYFETTRRSWIRIGDISSSLLRRGITLPMPDLIVAGLAIENDCKVYSLDAHFVRIPGLSRFNP